MRDKIRRAEQRHNGSRLELLHQASQQRLPDPPTTALRGDDHILHIRAQHAVSHRPGKPDEVLAVPRTHSRCHAQHMADLLRRALWPPALRPIQLEHAFSGNLTLAARHHCNVSNIHHITDSGPRTSRGAGFNDKPPRQLDRANFDDKPRPTACHSKRPDQLRTPRPGRDACHRTTHEQQRT